MKAMLLCAGLGLRMRPLTARRAKPTLPVLGEPLVCGTLRRLARAGVREVVINLHHRPASVRRAVGDGRRFGLRVRYSYERTILGTGGGPRRVRRRLGPGPVLLVNGDVVFDFDLRALVRRHVAAGAAATLALRPNPDPRRYGPVVTGADGGILSILGRPRRARGRVSLFTGVHVVESSLLARLPRGASDSVRDLYIPLLAEGARLMGMRPKGAWYDLGGPSQYLDSQLRMLRRRRGGRLVLAGARIAPDARVSRCVIGRASVVGAGAQVTDSVLWEKVRIGAGARVSRCVLADGATIAAGERIEGQVVTKTERRPL